MIRVAVAHPLKVPRNAPVDNAHGRDRACNQLPVLPAPFGVKTDFGMPTTTPIAYPKQNPTT